MPRLNLSDDEAAMIERFRRKNAEVIAHNRAINLAIDAFEQWADTTGHLLGHRRQEFREKLDALIEKVPSPI